MKALKIEMEYDDCIVGYDILSDRFVYSKEKMVETYMLNQRADLIEAIEFFEYNTWNAYVGEHTPIWVDDPADFISLFYNPPESHNQ